MNKQAEIEVVRAFVESLSPNTYAGDYFKGLVVAFTAAVESDMPLDGYWSPGQAIADAKLDVDRAKEESTGILRLVELERARLNDLRLLLARTVSVCKELGADAARIERR